MNRAPIGKSVIWLLAALLLVGGSAYVIKGLAMPWISGQDIDLKLRNDEYAVFAEHIYPHGRVAGVDGHRGITNYTVYPPYAFTMFAPLFSPPGYNADRALFQILSVGALALMAVYGAGRLQFAGPAATALGAAIPLAFSGNYVALYQGQFSIICTGLIIAQIMLLERRHPTTAGICWAFAMLKPQIGFAFAALFLVGPRRNLRGILVGGGTLLLLSAMALIWTGSSPENVMVNGFLKLRLQHMLHQPNAAGMWMEFTALTPVQAAVLIVGILAIAGALLWIFGRHLTERLPVDETSAVCAALGYAAFYHVHYDNMMLFPLLLALVSGGFRERSIVLLVTAAILGFICYAEPEMMVGAAQNSTFARWFIFLWPLVSSAVLLVAMQRHTPSTEV